MTTKRKVTKKEKEVIEDFEQKDEEVEEEVDDIELEEGVDVTLQIYKELGLTSAATTGEIKSAYRKLVLKYHPGAYGYYDDGLRSLNL